MPVFCAIVVAIVYAFSLDGDVGFWDTGELQTVPYLPGLMHPTGYPAEILLGWLFTHVVPFGDPALRMTLFCALCVALAAGCCCAVGQLLGARAEVAAGASLCFAFTPVVWTHATHADVTDPALAFCALTLLAGAYAVDRDEPRALYAAAVCAAFALGTHGTVVWFLPLPVLLVVMSGNVTLRRALPACALLTVVLAAALYAYLPLRSAMVTAAHADPTRSLGIGSGKPFWDWGHPSTLSGFVDVVTGASVKSPQSLAAILQPQGYPRDAAFLLGQLRDNFGRSFSYVVAALALAGAWGSRPRALLLLPLLLVAPFAANFAAESDASRYFGFPFLCLWVLAGVGVSRLSGRVPNAAAVARVGALALVAVAGVEAYAGSALFGQRDDALGRTYIGDVLLASEPRAVLIAEWVYATPLAYAAYVEHAVGERIVVAGRAADYARELPGWTRTRPVYAIAESPPEVPVSVVLVRALGVNPDAVHDPKLYRLGGPAHPR